MKCNGIPGEFAFRALFLKPTFNNQEPYYYPGWVVSENCYFSLKEAERSNPDFKVKWPVEVYEDGSIYIPSEGEIKDVVQQDSEHI